MEIEPLKIHQEGAVRTLSFNRPEVLNALDASLAQALRDAVYDAEFDDSVRCVVLTGVGDGFMAGGDISFFSDALTRTLQERKAFFHRLVQQVNEITISLRRMPKPVIASVNGAAAGYGLSLMMACDMSVASEKSTFTMAYASMGLSPDGGATFLLPRAMSRHRAAAFAMGGETLSCGEAFEMGLISKKVPHQALEDATQTWTSALCQGSALAFKKTKALLNRAEEGLFLQQLSQEEEAFAQCAASEEFEHRVKRFLQHRTTKHKTASMR